MLPAVAVILPVVDVTPVPAVTVVPAATEVDAVRETHVIGPSTLTASNTCNVSTDSVLRLELPGIVGGIALLQDIFNNNQEKNVIKN
jgi:hypothetical protein